MSPDNGSQTRAPERVKFDSLNVLVDSSGTPDYIDLMMSVPLLDGTVTETKMRFHSPTLLTHEDGKTDYKMDVNSNFSITRMARKADGPVTMQSQDGLDWEIPVDYPGAGTALLIHEPKVKEFLTGRFRQGDVFADVGANVGAYSIRAAAKGMLVHAFEPNPESVSLLRRNADLNHVSVDVRAFALGASSGTVRFAPFGGTSRVSPEGSMEVPLSTLDSFELPRIDLLKVDVEGYELEVMKGARRTLVHCRPTIMIEVHHWLGARGEAQLFDILEEADYDFEYLDRYANGRHLIASPKTRKQS